MSSMLEQAIVDAGALREAALKNAENIIIEKYSGEIKEAVDALLSEVAADDDPGADQGFSSDYADREINHPAHGDSDIEGCACPEAGDEDGGEVITLKIGDLMAMAEQEEALPGEMLGSTEEMAEELSSEVEPVAEDDDVEITEGELFSLLEKMVVEMEPTMSGWAGRPQKQLEHEVDVDLASRVDESDEEEEPVNERIEKDYLRLKREMKRIRHEYKKTHQHREELLEENKKLKETLNIFGQKIEEVNLQSAKLFYTNQTLVSPSLNERQKVKIAEAISKSGSLNEAKTIFETLRSSMGSIQEKKAPQSLNEVMNRKASLLTIKRQKTDPAKSPVYDRMKRLAGLK